MDDIFNNIIDGTQLKENLTRAFNDLDDILVDHSGPFATSCVIGSRWRQINDVDEFTKDGIKILRHLIVSEEPSARFAARMVRFVGIAVDKRCHDGTTTSMLLFCRLATVAMMYLSSNIYLPQRYNWMKTLSNALLEAQSQLNELRITEDDILARCEEFNITTTVEDIRAAIAFHMAMISSKGDVDLSEKIAEVIRSCPKKIYGMFKDTPLAIETEEPYVLKRQDYDLAVRATIGHIQDYNHKNDSQWYSPNAVIFATGNDIVSDSFESLFLQAFISTNPRIRANLAEYGEIGGWETYHEGKKNLIIMSPMVNDPNLMAEIAIFNANNPNVRISWFNSQPHPRMRTSLNKTIHYMAGVSLFNDVMGSDPTLSLIGLNGPPVIAHLIGTTLTFTNLYEKDGGVYHPFFANPERYEPYTQFVKDTEELIEFANSNLTNPALDPEELTYLTSLYRSLTCQEIYDIEIGGSAHDQYANRTVYEDAIGAALSAISEGVVLGGYGHLARYFNKMYQVHNNDTFLECAWGAIKTAWTALGDRAMKLTTSVMSVVSKGLRVHHDIYLDTIDGATDVTTAAEVVDAAVVVETLTPEIPAAISQSANAVNAANQMSHEFANAFFSIVEDSLRAASPLDGGGSALKTSYVRDLIMNQLDSKWDYVVADANAYTLGSMDENYISAKTFDEASLIRFLSRDPDDRVLLQAYGGYHEQFRRFRDMLPKLANTTHLADMRIQEGADVR